MIALFAMQWNEDKGSDVQITDFRPFRGILFPDGSVSSGRPSRPVRRAFSPAAPVRCRIPMAGPSTAGRGLFRREPALLPALLDAADQQTEDPEKADGPHDAEQAEDCQDGQPQDGDGGKVDNELTQLPFHPGHLLSVHLLFLPYCILQYTKKRQKSQVGDIGADAGKNTIPGDRKARSAEIRR